MLDLGLWREVLTHPFRDSPQADVEIWRPVTSLTFALNGSLNRALGLAAEHPASFHVFNVLAHALASAMTAVFALRLGLKVASAAAVGLLFAVHPIHVEAVANVVQRAEPLAVVFGLAFLMLLRSGSRWAGLPLLLALGSKESAIGFVGWAIAWDACSPRTARRGSAWISPAIALAVFFVWRAEVLDGQSGRAMILENPIADGPTVERIATALRVQLLYLRLLVWPVGLSSDYSYDQIPVVRSLFDARVIAFAAIVAGSIAAAWALRRSRIRIAIGVVGYACLFGVASNLILPIGTIAGERLAYAPSLAFCLLAGEGLQIAIERGHARVGTGAAAIALLACAILTVERNRVWSDEITLFRDQVATAPRSAKAHLNLATVLQRAGQDAEAAREADASLAIYPENAQTWYVQAIALYNLRAQPKLVVQAFENTLRFGPMHHEARVKYVLVLLQLHAPDLAEQQIGMLARIAPEHPRLPDLRARLAVEMQRRK